MKKLTMLLLMTVLCLSVQAEDQSKRIDLSGTWQFALDRQGTIKVGDTLTETIQLPGTTDTNKKGDFTAKSEETTHLTRPWSYKGKAWYQREVEIPASWKGKPVYLLLERTKPSEVYIDGQLVGTSNDISTPQVFNLPKGLKPGKHQLTIMVDNGSGVPEQLYASSHAYTEDTQTNWNGIIGRIELFTGDYSAKSGPANISSVNCKPSTVNPIFKDFHIEGQHFYANGHQIFLRGKHDACVWPLTGHVAMDVESWKDYLGTCDAYGLNHVRFHSWCPPEAAFVAADELGIILQPEHVWVGDFFDSTLDESIERYSVLRATMAIDRADVCLILIDARDGVTEQDTKIAGLAHEAGKASIVVVNKWDLVEKETGTMEKMRKDIMRDLSFMSYAPILFISALTGQRTNRIFELINFVNDQSNMRITTGMLNNVLADAQARVQPPTDKGRRLKLYYMTQTGVKPPCFVIFVNSAELFHFSYQRYIENQIRAVFGFEGTPIRLVIRQKGDNDS